MTSQPELIRGDAVPIKFAGTDHGDREQEKYRKRAEQQGIVLRQHEKIE
jgi:hypothetical protein